MRIAYYGLSSPIFYDYSVAANKTKHDLKSSPNPILESAWGAMILCDELWFFCESLCPDNLRNKPFVKYLINEDLGRIVSWYDIDRYRNVVGEFSDINRRSEMLRNQVDSYWDLVKSSGVKWDNPRPDNHTHSLKVCDLNVSASSLNIHNILFDFEVVEFLNSQYSHDIELVTNSFTQAWLNSNDQILSQMRLSEMLVIESIPNYLSQYGPYDEGVLQFRENKYIKDFRSKITDLQLSPNASKLEIEDMKKGLENEIKKAMLEDRLKYISASMFRSVFKSLVGFVVDKIPGLSPVLGLAKLMNQYEDQVNNKWQAFLITQELKRLNE